MISEWSERDIRDMFIKMLKQGMEHLRLLTFKTFKTEGKQIIF